MHICTMWEKVKSLVVHEIAITVSICLKYEPPVVGVRVIVYPSEVPLVNAGTEPGTCVFVQLPGAWDTVRLLSEFNVDIYK